MRGEGAVQIVVPIAANGHKAKAGAASAAVVVQFCADVYTGVGREVIRQNAVKRVVVAMAVWQIIAAVVANQHGAPAQGFVGVEWLVGIQHQARVFP